MTSHTQTSRIPTDSPAMNDDTTALKTVAVEEHFWTPELREALIASDEVKIGRQFPGSEERLLEIGDERLRRMDDVGVDVQVLSVTAPGTQVLAAAQAIPLARDANDFAADAVTRHPDRFAAFATLPTPDPDAAGTELRRAVTELGMVGAMIFPRTGELMLDHPSLRPIFETAAELRVPLYIHPQFPPQVISDLYYSGFDPAVSIRLATGGWGWHAEAGLSALRLILAGTFDRHPDLQIILGHWGEMLISFVDRANSLTRLAGLQRSIAEVITTNTLVTSGGIYSHRMLQTAINAVGIDCVLMATDEPFRPGTHNQARNFITSAPISPNDQAKIAHANAQRFGLAPSTNL